MSHGKQMERCARALMRASLSLSSTSPYRLNDLILARNEINRTIAALRPQPRRNRATVALFAAVGAVVFIAAPVGLRLLTLDRPAVEGKQ